MSDTLVPEPQTIFDSVAKALIGHITEAARVASCLTPNLAKGFRDGKPVEIEHEDEPRGTLVAA